MDYLGWEGTFPSSSWHDRCGMLQETQISGNRSGVEQLSQPCS